MNIFIISLLFFTSLFSITESMEQVSNDIIHEKEIKTQSGGVNIMYPPELHFDESLFKKYSKEDIPYVFERLSIDLFNKGEFRQAALNAIASIWCGNNNYDFISNLEDYNHGIVKMVKSLKNSDDFDLAVQLLTSH